MTTFACLLCNAILGDCQAALSHECAVDKAVLEKAQLHKIDSERDKRERAQFAIQIHSRYLFYLNKLVVPYDERCEHGSTALDCRTMDEFNCSLDTRLSNFQNSQRTTVRSSKLYGARRECRMETHEKKKLDKKGFAYWPPRELSKLTDGALYTMQRTTQSMQTS